MEMVEFVRDVQVIDCQEFDSVAGLLSALSLADREGVFDGVYALKEIEERWSDGVVRRKFRVELLRSRR